MRLELRSGRPCEAGTRTLEGAPLPRPRALVLSLAFVLPILVHPADSFSARVSGIAVPPLAPSRAAALEPEKRPTPEPQPPQIRIEVADSLLHPPLPPGLPFGATWVDIDGDGDLDLTIPLDRDDPPSLLVYRNDHGIFHDITSDLGLQNLTKARSAVWLDLNGDGALDLYVTRRSDADGNRMYENVKGKMVEVTPPGVPGEPGNDVAQAWGDFDKDGDPDLFLGGVVVTRPRLFRNDGNFHFTDVTVQAGLDTTAETVTAVWSDFDGDGDLDLALGDVFDFRLFLNQGNGTFVEAPLPIVAPGALLVSPSFADVNGDGKLDLLVGGLFPSLMLENKFDPALPPSQWFTNRNVTWGSGPLAGSGGTWADLDLDGDPDLLAASGSRGARVFENRVPEGGRLTDISAALGMPDTLGVTWHPSAGDYDGDGLPDFFAPHDAVPHLYHNISIPGGQPLRLHLVPRVGGVALGATVRFVNGGKIQLREIEWPASGFSYPSPDVDLAVFDGQKNQLAADVRWTSGIWERFEHLHTGKLESLVEGKGRPLAPAQAQALTADSRGPASGLDLSCNPCREALRFERVTPAAWGQVTVYDALGRRVRALAPGISTWDLHDAQGVKVPAGVYWLRAAPLTGTALPVPQPTRVVVLP
jgi:hypothetical protein